MKYVSHRLKNLILVLSIFLFMQPGLPHVFAQNGVMMQYFHWYYPDGGLLWNEVAGRAEELAAAGITALWLPPAYKGASPNDVGYGVYDLYDLGEFDQKGTARTKYGTKDQYLNAVAAAHRAGIQIYADVVFNHKMGADFTEKIKAVRVAGDNRNYEYGGNIWIQAWTGFDFPKRSDKYSSCHNGKTFWGQNVYAVGSIPELGDWDPDKARILSSENHPDWENSLSHLPPDTYIEWKCIKRDGAGNVEWQPGENNTFTTPASGTGMTSGSF